MQLSAPSTPADLLLATLAAPKLAGEVALAPGLPSPTAAPSGPALGFAQLFPELASALPAGAPINAPAANPSATNVTTNFSPLVSTIPLNLAETTPVAPELAVTGNPPPATPTAAVKRAATSERSACAREETSETKDTREWMPMVLAPECAPLPIVSIDEVADSQPAGDAEVPSISPEQPRMLPGLAWKSGGRAAIDSPRMARAAAETLAVAPNRDAEAAVVSSPTPPSGDTPERDQFTSEIKDDESLPASAPSENASQTSARAVAPIQSQQARSAEVAMSREAVSMSASRPEVASVPAIDSVSRPVLEPTAPTAQARALTNEVQDLGTVVQLEPTVRDPRPLRAAITRATATAIDAARASRGEAENIAAFAGKNFAEKISSEPLPSKTFLNATDEEVRRGEASLGIDVAKSSSTMPALAPEHRAAPAAVPVHVAPAHPAMLQVGLMARSEPLFATDAPAAAHRAVEAVLNAAERFSASDRHAVNLQFSVGGADLAVRVELRADEVRATFRTDSPELRAALAREWQAVSNSDAGERSLRLATPVFTSNSNDNSGLAAFADGGASRQRDTDARRSASEVFASVASRARSAVSQAADEVTAPVARLGTLPTSLHLHTLA